MKSTDEEASACRQQPELSPLARDYDPVYNLDGRRFVTHIKGDVFPAAEIIYSFCQTEQLVRGEFYGGEIVAGCFLGKFIAADRMELLFQCVTRDFSLLSGVASGLVTGDPSATLKLFVNWQWLNGAMGKGAAVYTEV